jgi:hypothetical protein
MKTRSGNYIVALICVAGVFSIFAVNGSAQKKAASKTTPRLADGHPDLNGGWLQTSGPPSTLYRVENGLLAAFRKEGDSVIYGGKPPVIPTQDWIDSPPPYKPELLSKIDALDKDQVHADPSFSCGPPGVPRIGPPQHIMQTASEVAFFYVDPTGEFYRLIRIGGAHNPDADPSNFGDSVAKWEGDTLVVDVTNFNDQTWLGDNGLFHSTVMHVVERLRREGDILHYQVTVEDPSVFTKPWVMDPRTLAPFTEDDRTYTEGDPCKEMDSSHISGLSHHTNLR